MKNGKRPISQKLDYVDPAEAFGGSSLSLHEDILKYFEKNDLAYKWLAIRHFKEKGRHPAGWQLFKVPSELKEHVLVSQFNKVGTEFMESGDLILGVKPKFGSGVSQENHKRVLKQRVLAKTMEAQGVDEDGNPLIKVER